MYKLPSSCSVFTADYIAVFKTFDFIKNNNRSFSHFLSANNNIKNIFRYYIYNLKNNNIKIKMFWITC